jgi:hypothetical protein
MIILLNLIEYFSFMKKIRFCIVLLKSIYNSYMKLIIYIMNKLQLNLIYFEPIYKFKQSNLRFI